MDSNLFISDLVFERAHQIIQAGRYDNLQIKEPHEFVDHALGILQDAPECINELKKSTIGQAKSNLMSDTIRRKGNKCYFQHKWLKALKHYNLAIVHAETNSAQLAMGYANRSALLFERKFYKECLEDVEKALKIQNYSEEKKSKLLSRQKSALEQLPTQETKSFHTGLPNLPTKNPKVQAASNSVKINQNPKYGRFIEATKDIEGGEIIVIEYPYAMALKNNKKLYCSECAALCLNMIPCPLCSVEMYCSETCLSKAYEDYHEYECVVARYYDTTFMEQPLGWVALRTVLKGLKEYKNLKNESSDIYESHRYKEIFELNSNFDCLSKSCIMELTFNVAKIFHVLKNETNLLEKIDITENELKFLLLKEKLSNGVNNLPVQVFTPAHKYVADSIGAGLYSFGSLFNHSCVENVELFSYGSALVCRANKKIRKGDQCFINYGMSYLSEKKEARQKTLKFRYSFTCDCRACNNNWPIVGEAGLSNELNMRDLPSSPQMAMKLVQLLQETCSDDGVNKITDENREEILQKLFVIQDHLRASEPSTVHVILYEILNNALRYGNTLYDI